MHVFVENLKKNYFLFLFYFYFIFFLFFLFFRNKFPKSFWTAIITTKYLNFQLGKIFIFLSRLYSLIKYLTMKLRVKLHLKTPFERNVLNNLTPPPL